MIIALRTYVLEYLDELHQLFIDAWRHPTTLAFALFALFGMLVLMCAWMLWWLAALLLLAWGPLALHWTLNNALRHPGLGLFCLLISLQSPHIIEHIAQMVEIHLLGWNPAVSHGVLGQFLDTAWLLPPISGEGCCFWPLSPLLRKYLSSSIQAISHTLMLSHVLE